MPAALQAAKSSIMATVTRENIGLLNDKLTVKVSKDDYLPVFEKTLKNYSKTVNIPGFRKGMVPAGMIKKMYGPSIFTDEILKTVEKELYAYLGNEKPDIFAQPLALDADIRAMDVNNPADYEFGFEIGLKPNFEVAPLDKAKLVNHIVKVTPEAVQEEISKMQIKGSKTKLEEGVVATEANVEKRELNEEFFNEVFPGQAIATEEEFRTKLREEIQSHWDAQSKNQLHDQIYHYLIDNTKIEFPESFLKRWLQNGGDKPKTAEEAEAEFPIFSNQLKWTLISDKLIKSNNLQVEQQELRDNMKNEVMRYFGSMSLGEDTSWLESYIDRMMKDEKQVESSYHRLLTEKLFNWAQENSKSTVKEVTGEELTALQHNHQH
jgi:FKBP-type peptidyl-prolyl cis-trans isomerase (trigger factor)